MKKVTLHYYSAINLGDDLFVKLIAGRYSNKFLIPYRSKRRVFRDTDNLLTASSILRAVLNKLKVLLSTKRTFIDTASLEAGELVVYVGGSIFIEGNDMEYWFNQRDFFNNLKKPYYILGSNIGPYESPSFLPIVKEILSKAEDVCLRDSASYELVRELPNTRLSSDMVFSLDTSLYDVKNEKLVIFSLVDCRSRFSEELALRYEEEIRKMTRKFINDGFEVVYMSFCEHEGDEAFNTQVINQLEDDIRERVKAYSYRGNLDESLQLIASSTIIIATRFHAAILGLVFGKKVLPMAYSAKTINILKDIEFKGPVVDINKIASFDSSALDIENLQINDISKQVKLAELQFQELDKVLERRIK